MQQKQLSHYSSPAEPWHKAYFHLQVWYEFMSTENLPVWYLLENMTARLDRSAWLQHSVSGVFFQIHGYLDPFDHLNPGAFGQSISNRNSEAPI